MSVRTVRAHGLFRLVTVGVAYYVAARLGLRLALVGRSVTPLWPPTGVALVALMAWGRRMWPAVAAAAFAVNAPISPSLVAAAGIAVGNTVAPLVASQLLSRVGFRIELDRVRDAVALVFLAALASMSVSATIGTVSLVFSGAVTSGHFLSTWSVWWTGDAMGVLIVAPFLWAMGRARLRPGARDAGTVTEAVAVTCVLIGACALAFAVQQPLVFVVFPVIGWIAWRYEQQGAAPAALLVSVVATWAAAHHTGPFAGESLLQSMVALQSLNATVALTAIFLASAVSQREEKAARERQVVATLQRSLLPTLPDIASVAVAARYIPASIDAQLGGDWYDIVPLPEGRLGFAVGDVAGHGLDAAATMGQLRMALRAYALEQLTPGGALEHLNRLVHDLQVTALTTVWYGQFDPATALLTFASAGHLPPLLIEDETTSFVEELRAPPLGAMAGVTYPEASCRLDPGMAVLLYTDGLIERRDVPLDVRLEALRVAARTAPIQLEAFCDHIVDQMLDEAPADDVALLSIRSAAPTGRFHVHRPASPTSVPEMRRVMRSWLADNGVGVDEAFDILVAVSEAQTNAVQHAYGLADGTVETEAVLLGDELRITVRDSGTWRATSVRDDVDGDGGRGLMVMRALMDTVDVLSSADGTEVQMTCRLHAPARHGRRTSVAR